MTGGFFETFAAAHVAVSVFRSKFLNKLLLLTSECRRQSRSGVSVDQQIQLPNSI